MDRHSCTKVRQLRVTFTLKNNGKSMMPDEGYHSTSTCRHLLVPMTPVSHDNKTNKIHFQHRIIASKISV